MWTARPDAPSVALIQQTAAFTAEELGLIAWRERRAEWGGLVWGRRYLAEGGPAVWLAAMTPGVGRASAVDFQMDPESYVVGLRMLERSGFPPDLEELGMWHTHPSYGVFLSSVDEEYFQLCWPQSWTVSVVFDPVNGDRGVFVKSASSSRRIPTYIYSGRSFGLVPALDPWRAWRAVEGFVR